ncbi:MAG: hypothetical protein ACRDRX_19365 [Pseudonocardiaceae bacterium]
MPGASFSNGHTGVGIASNAARRRRRTSRAGVRVQPRGQTAQGRFDPVFGSFMGIRSAGETYRHRRCTSVSHTCDSARHRTTTLDLTRPWEQSAFWFFAHTALPPGTTFSLLGEDPDLPPRNTVLQAPGGSWCEVREDRDDDGTRTVWETGPHSLWRIIEDAHARWCRLDRPGWGRFGLTVTAERQSIWLDTPDSEHIWTPPDFHRVLSPERGD